MMSKQDFVGLADSLRSVLYPPPGFVAFNPEQREAVIKEVAGFCKGQNPRFDKDLWVGYLKGENGPNGGKR